MTLKIDHIDEIGTIYGQYSLSMVSIFNVTGENVPVQIVSPTGSVIAVWTL